MNKFLKAGVALALAVLITLSCASCASHKKTELDLSKFPLVFADENGLEAMNEGDDKPTLITKNFYTFLNAEHKVQAASNGKIYYIETPNKKTTIGDLYAYDVEKKEAELVHSGVYSYKVSHDGECIIISNGTGGIFKYDKKHERKNDYTLIQKSGVSGVLDISADGKYVLYSQVLKNTSYYTLTIAKTDFETNEKLDAQTLKERLSNKDISKAPVIIAQNYKQFIGAADDLSVVYYEQAGEEKDAPNQLCAFTSFKNNIVLTDKEHEQFFVNDNGEMLFNIAQKNMQKISDIITDKYEKKDAKLKKKSASKKEWKAKQQRDEIRKKAQSYLKNITTYDFYRFSKDLKQPEKVLTLAGQMSAKGTDASLSTAFFGSTLYDFSAAKKPDINKVSMVYKLFDDIKSREFSAVTFKGIEHLDIDDKIDYNSGDVYVDTNAKKINIIMEFDYLKKKVGNLYTVAYDEQGFGNAKLVSNKAAKVPHFDNAEGVYFVTAAGALVYNDVKTVVLENYGFSGRNGSVPIAFTSIPTKEKDKFGNVIAEETAYLIQGKKALKLGAIYANKDIVTKGNMFAFYTDYDYKSGVGEMMLYNGEKLINIGKNISAVYKFGD